MSTAIKKKNNFKLKYYISYIMVAVVMFAAIIMQQTGHLARSNSNLLVQVAYSIILAVSLNLVVGFLGELSLGHAGFMCVGAYLGGYLAIQLSEVIESKLLVLIISMLIGGLIAAIFGLIVGLRISLAAAGYQRKRHHQCQKQRNKLFHGRISFRIW